jgi:peptidyl-prolyl cis-trans isomerase SurA
MMRSAAVILLCLLFAIPAICQSKKDKKILPVFSVSKKTVTADEFIYLYKKNHQSKPEEFTKEKIQEYLDLFINFKLKVEEARARGLDTTAAFKKEFNTYKEELRKPYLPDNKLSDSLARLTYERLKEEVNASHILIDVKSDASPEDTLKAYNEIMSIRKRVVAGEDFGTLAMQYSKDQSAKVNKGSLGYFTAMQMVYPFENAAYRTKVGEVSMPARTRFGYHIVKVNDRRPASGEVEVSHIMIGTGEGKDATKARNQIFEIYDQLQGGVKWEDLCKQYSDDPSTKDNGGRLRPFGIGALKQIPTFEEAAFALKKEGDISDPFQTPYGWHIIRLEKKILLKSFDEIATTLKSQVNRDERTQLSRQALQQKLRKEFSFTEFTEVKKKAFSLGDTSLRSAKWKVPASFNDNTVLFSLQGKTFSINEFLLHAQKNQRPNSMTPEKYMESLYNSFVDININSLLEEKIIRNNPEFQLLLNEYYEGILLFEIMEKEVWNKASEDSVGQVRFFNENRVNYVAGERAKTIIYSSASKDVIGRLREKIAMSDTVKLADFVTINKIRQEGGAFEREEKSILSKMNWAEGLQTSETNGMYYLAWIKRILPPGQKTFEEARPAVISDYQNHLEKVWLVALKKKYPVKQNAKGKAYVFEKLQTK